MRVTARRSLDDSGDLVKLFVYGTLLSGEPSHDRLRGARLIASTRTQPRYTLVSLGPYPALIEGGSTSVAGEVYDVDDELLRAVDRFEGVPSLYQRVRIHLLGGSVAQGYALAAGCPCCDNTGTQPRSRSASCKKHRLIPGGDWRAYRRGSPR